MKKREGTITRGCGACYRRVTLNPGELLLPLEKGSEHSLIVPVIRAYGRDSFRKCKEGSKNTERMFVPGDIVTVVVPPGMGPNDNVWFLVEKRRNKALRTWVRPLDELRVHIVEAEVAVLDCPVYGRGAVKSVPWVKTPNVECLAISLDRKTRIWVEAGLFKDVIHCSPLASAETGSVSNVGNNSSDSSSSNNKEKEEEEGEGEERERESTYYNRSIHNLLVPKRGEEIDVGGYEEMSENRKEEDDESNNRVCGCQNGHGEWGEYEDDGKVFQIGACYVDAGDFDEMVGRGPMYTIETSNPYNGNSEETETCARGYETSESIVGVVIHGKGL